MTKRQRPPEAVAETCLATNATNQAAAKRSRRLGARFERWGRDALVYKALAWAAPSFPERREAIIGRFHCGRLFGD